MEIETPLTQRQKDLAWEAADRLYAAMRIKVNATKAYTAAAMWDELVRRNARLFTPNLMRPVQPFMVAQLKAIAVARMREETGALPDGWVSVEPPDEEPEPIG